VGGKRVHKVALRVNLAGKRDVQLRAIQLKVAAQLTAAVPVRETAQLRAMPAAADVAAKPSRMNPKQKSNR
jgi:hypothetical protein